MRKHTRRRHWPVGHVLLPQQRDDLALPAHMAMAAIEMGGGCTEHRHTLAAFGNIAACMAANMPGVAPETKAAVLAGQEAIVSADKRFLARGAWGLTGPEMLAMRRMLVLGDELLKRVTSTELARYAAWVYEQNLGTPETLGTRDAPLPDPQRGPAFHPVSQPAANAAT